MKQVAETMLKELKQHDVDPILIDKLCGNSGYILTKAEIEKAMEEKEDE